MGPDFDSFDDLQCEDVYGDDYVLQEDFDEDVNDDEETGYVGYDDLVDFSTLDFSDY